MDELDCIGAIKIKDGLFLGDALLAGLLLAHLVNVVHGQPMLSVFPARLGDVTVAVVLGPNLERAVLGPHGVVGEVVEHPARLLNLLGRRREVRELGRHRYERYEADGFWWPLTCVFKPAWVQHQHCLCQNSYG